MTNKRIRDKELRKVAAKAKKQGWEVELTKKNHLRFTSPDGEVVGNSGTPSDYRGQKNFLADLKRAGFKDNE